MTEREALKLALDWFCCYLDKSMSRNNQETLAEEAITAIKEALAQPNPWEKFCDSNCVWTDHHPDCKLAEQEPFAFLHPQKGFYFAKPTKISAPTIVDVEPLPLYTTPLQRKPLTLDELWRVFTRSGLSQFHQRDSVVEYKYQKCIEEFARAIEAAHGIKGEA